MLRDCMAHCIVIGVDIGGSHIGYSVLSYVNHELLLERHEALDCSLSSSKIFDQIVLAIQELVKYNQSWELIAAGISIFHPFHHYL